MAIRKEKSPYIGMLVIQPGLPVKSGRRQKLCKHAKLNSWSAEEKKPGKSLSFGTFLA